MNWFLVTLRRAILLVLLGAVGGVVWSWWRERSTPSPTNPPEWPPIPATATASGANAPSPSTPSESVTDDTAAVDDPAAPTTSSASIVNALVDAPEARSPAGADATWVPPLDDGSCPASHPIKANDNSGIFHVPGGRFYDRTKAERCYASPEAAAADGYRQAKS